MSDRASAECPVRWPAVVIFLYAALVPLQPVLTLSDGSPLRVAAADALAPLVVLAAIARPRRRLPFGLVALAGAIAVLAVISTAKAAMDRSLSLYSVGKAGGVCYLIVLGIAAARALGPDAPRVILRGLVWGAVWSSAVGLLGFAAWLGGTSTWLVHGDRLCSTMTGDPNIFGSVVGVGLVATVADPRASASGRAARGLLLLLALLATGSRSAVLGTVAALAVLAANRGRDPFLAVARTAYLALAFGLVAALLLSTESGAVGAARVWRHHWRDFTVTSRLGLYSRAWAEFSTHPVTGLGIGGFRDANTFVLGGQADHFVVHNTYLWALVDLGVLGGLLVVGLTAAGVWRCLRAARARTPTPYAAAAAAGLVAMAVFNLFIDGFYQRHFWLLVACAVAMPVFRRVQRHAHAGSQPLFAGAGP